MNYLKRYKRLLFCTALFLPTSSLAINRIENFNVDRKSVNKIYLSFSKASLIRFPNPIEEVRVGLPNFYKTEVSKTYSRELTLFLGENTKKPSNLIVRTSNEDIYVFDLVPSGHNHQDVVFVDESYYKKREQRQSTKRTRIVQSPQKKLIISGSKRIKILTNRTGGNKGAGL